MGVLALTGRASGQTLTTLWQFSGNNGQWPLAGLVQGIDGNFYGRTLVGGTNGSGTVFKITPQGTLTTLYQFGARVTVDNAAPAGLIQGTDGNFYGTAQTGGDAGDGGYVFRLTPQGMLTTLWQFSGINGSGPAGLVQGSDGNFYGTTSGGGTNGSGTVFKITPQGTLTTLWQFGDFLSTAGAHPAAGLVQGSDGNFYGTTSFGGTNNDGAVFKITPQGTLTTLWQFSGRDGRWPTGLVQGGDGNFYGTTPAGGTNRNNLAGGHSGDGTVFKITPQGTLTTLYQFEALVPATRNRIPNATSPGQLIHGTDGNFYGTTCFGGTNEAGTVFRITPQGTLTTLWQFNPRFSGSNTLCPCGLVQGSDGNLYGTTSRGGRYGTVFKITPQGR
jgi:uncharacterized repeat protein (TIGR03803 family)